MSEEITGAEGSQASIPEIQDIGGTPEGTVGTEPKGEVSTPTKKEIEEFDKIDATKLNPEQLKIYKHFQAQYTKARMKDKTSLTEYETNLKSYQELMKDPEIYARAHLLVYGKLPDGYVAPRSAAVGPGPAETPNASIPSAEEEFVDPAIKALRDEVNQMKTQNYQAEKAKVTNEVVSFESELFKNKDFEQIYKTNYAEIRRAAVAFHAQGYDTKTSLKKAFNSIAADSLFENGKKAAWGEVERKAQETRPLKGGGGPIVPKGGKGLAAAFAQAEAEVGE